MMETPQLDRTAPLSPLPTGVPGLDTVLGGGLPSGDLLFIIGLPGAGKTVMALQIAFGRIRDGGKVLLLTTFSESHDKLIAHLRGFDFFDVSVLGQQLQFVSILPMLQAGTEETTREIVRTARQQGTDLVIIDGFRGIRDAFESDLATRQFLQLLATQLAYLGTTLVITVETSTDNVGMSAELSTGDSIVALEVERVGRQQRRNLEVRKIRGQAPVPGLHRYRIDREGITVFPRFEAMVVEPLGPSELGRAQFGLSGLDKMLVGGLTSSTSTLVIGSPGTGKTLLGMHFLFAGVTAGEVVLLVTTHESLDQLRDKANAVGFNLDDAIERGMLRIIRRAPVELDVDELAVAISQEILERPIRRLVIDGLDPLSRALQQDDRVQDYLAALVELLRARHVTGMFVAEVPSLPGIDLDINSNPFVVLSENLIVLRQVEYRSRLHRVVSVIKTRFSTHESMIREFVIGDSGIVVGEPMSEVDSELLEGVTDQVEGHRASTSSTRRRGK